MKKIITLVLLIPFTHLFAETTNNSAFFRISNSRNTILTDLNPSLGIITWSNHISKTTNQLQRAYSLKSKSNWVDFAMLTNSSTGLSSAKIIDLNPPSGMVFIPEGCNIGTNATEEGEGEVYYPSRYPSSYSVTSAGFFMDATEITGAQWTSVYNWAVTNGYSFANPGHSVANEHPIHTVSWQDCIKWCNARSQMEGITPCYTVGNEIYKAGHSYSYNTSCDFQAEGYRLPTIEEWQYAARGGSVSKRFPWGDTINHSNANYAAIGTVFSYDTSTYTTYTYHPDFGNYPGTAPVGKFPPNGYGLYDMCGNIEEWCWDYDDPSSHYTGGGSWAKAANVLLNGAHYGGATHASIYLGFRTVRK